MASKRRLLTFLLLIFRIKLVKRRLFINYRYCIQFPPSSYGILVQDAKMAECNKIVSSASIENSNHKTDSVVNKKEKSSFLFCSENNLTWKGDLKSLKAFVATVLIYDDAKWLSPRAEEKLFKTTEFTLKWHGPKKEKLQIIKDNEKKYLRSVLEANAQTNGVKNEEKKSK